MSQMHVEMRMADGSYRMEAVNPKGNVVVMDNPDELHNQEGASPMELLLMGLAGCSSIDIKGILEKKKEEVEDFRVVVTADRDRAKVPAFFSRIDVEYHLTGDANPNHVLQAVELSLGRYCTVAQILEKTVIIRQKTFLNGSLITE